MDSDGLPPFGQPLGQGNASQSASPFLRGRAASQGADDAEFPRCICACREQQSCCTRYASREFMIISSDVAALSADSRERHAILRTAVNAQSANIADLRAEAASSRQELARASAALERSNEMLAALLDDHKELRKDFAAMLFLTLSLFAGNDPGGDGAEADHGGAVADTRGAIAASSADRGRAIDPANSWERDEFIVISSDSEQNHGEDGADPSSRPNKRVCFN